MVGLRPKRLVPPYITAGVPATQEVTPEKRHRDKTSCGRATSVESKATQSGPSMKNGLSSRVEAENRFRAGVVEILLAVGLGRCVPFARCGLAANRWMIL